MVDVRIGLQGKNTPSWTCGDSHGQRRIAYVCADIDTEVAWRNYFLIQQRIFWKSRVHVSTGKQVRVLPVCDIETSPVDDINGPCQVAKIHWPAP
jgi:hypothetical protein